MATKHEVEWGVTSGFMSGAIVGMDDVIKVVFPV